MRRFALWIVVALVLSSLSTVASWAEADWPHPIPCRVEDGDNDDLFVITLGDVETPLAEGTFDPVADKVTLDDGTTIENYYRDELGVEFYRPIDKSVFPLPPSGWCTWYYYYPNITETEVKYNAQWIAENLKEYGAQYVQIDDGWQGSGGRDGGRDWSLIHPRRFPGEMKELADAIRAAGLKPGIWLAPHGQSRQQVIDDNPKVFLLDDDGESLSRTWEGQFLVDPRTEETHAYLAALFKKLRDWGYVYYKIDGQPIVVNEYANKVDDEDHALYRKTLDTIRGAIGPECYLLGCWGIPTEGMGIMNGSRTGGDVVRGWSRGFMLAAGATMRFYYQHNVAWYTDPDTMVLRSPLSVDQARAWATLQGLTGQALMASDRFMDLSEARVEMLRRVYPAVDARPLDLFPTNGRIKPIWDLKISHLDRDYDVVGIFNFDESELQPTRLEFADLGLPADKPVHVFDFWNKEYLGAWDTGLMVDVPPTSVRVLTLLPTNEQIQLISTSRHITQGWVDLESLAATDDGMVHEGRSRVISGDPYQLCFVFPRGKGFAVKSATAATAAAELPVKINNHQGWATVAWSPDETTQIDWRVEFEPGDYYRYRPEPVDNLQVAANGLDGASLSWNELYWLNAGYKVYLDGESLGYTGRSAFVLGDLDPGKSYEVAVATVWEDGSESRRRAETTFTLASLLPTSMRLVDLETVPVPTGGRGFGRRFGPPTGTVTIGETRYEDAITSRAIGYALKGVFARLTAKVGATAPASSDDDNEERSSRPLTFVVEGDGNQLWSGDITPGDELQTVEVEVAGVEQLVLRVEGGNRPRGRRGGRRRQRGGPTAAWIDARVVRGGDAED